MSECYVCLEETDHTSPCTCAAPIHENCFIEMQQHTKNKQCSICKQVYRTPITWRDIAFCTYVACVIMTVIILAWLILVERAIT